MSGDSKSIDDLDPRVATLCRKLLVASAAAGIPCRLTFTYRSNETQDALYAQGRTKPGKIVTNARAGSSFHNYHLAFDLVPEELVALPNWGDTPAHQARTNAVWAKVAQLGEGLGLRWGGRFTRPDRPHFEWSGALTIGDLRAGKRP